MQVPPPPPFLLSHLRFHVILKVHLIAFLVKLRWLHFTGQDNVASTHFVGILVNAAIIIPALSWRVTADVHITSSSVFCNNLSGESKVYVLVLSPLFLPSYQPCPIDTNYLLKFPAQNKTKPTASLFKHKVIIFYFKKISTFERRQILQV